MDDKAKKQLIGIACLVPVFILAWIYALGSCSRFHRAPPPPAPTPAAAAATSVASALASASSSQAPVPTAAAATTGRMGEILKYESGPWLRNPFKLDLNAPMPIQSPTTRASLPNMKLEGIVWDEKSPYAIIDGEIRTVGDSVRGFNVAEIRRDKVVLEKDGQKFDLGLFPEMR